MAAFHDRDDLLFLDDLKAAAPREFAAWARLDAVVAREDGEIPRKYRELIAVAAAHVTQCAYCLDVHTKAAVEVGASKAEVGEAALIAAALRAGGAGAHAALTMRLFDEHSSSLAEQSA